MLSNPRIPGYLVVMALGALIAVVPQQVAGQAAPLLAASASPTPSATPVILPFSQPEVPASQNARPKIIFVIGQGDPQTTGKLISALVEQLARYVLYFGDDNWLVPAPNMTLDAFAAQCTADREHTQGAFVVGLDSTANVTVDHFFSRTSYTQLTAHVLYAQCDLNKAKPGTSLSAADAPPVAKPPLPSRADRTLKRKISSPPSPSPKPSPTQTPKAGFVWYGYTTGEGDVNTLTLVTPIALSVGLGSLATAFIPSKSQTNTTVKTYPSPAPSTQNTTSSMSAFNPSSENSLAGVVFTGGAAYTSSQVSVPTGDLQTWSAVYQAIAKLVEHMGCEKKGNLKPESISEKYPPIESQGNDKMAPFCNGWSRQAPAQSP